MMQVEIAISVVTYKANPDVFFRCLNSIMKIRAPFVCYVLDNSADLPTQNMVKEVSLNMPKWGTVEYAANENVGYGKAHNLAMEKSLQDIRCQYHLVINPDVAFEAGTIESIIEFMDSHHEVGLVMPKISYPDGRIQYLCKLLPSPFDLFRRRFLPNIGYLRRLNDRYELRFSDHEKMMEVSYLSGCFMCLRVDALKRIGLFDERFFMYFEDTDLTRRIGRYYKTVYYPEVSVFHDYEKGSYKNLKLLGHHLISTIKYFNKWGYLFDNERRELNKTVMRLYLDKT